MPDAEKPASWCGRDYAWLDRDFSRKHPHFSQRWLFGSIGTISEIIHERWMKPSHKAVHLSSAAVYSGSEKAEFFPSNWSGDLRDEYSVATLYSTNSALASALELTLISPSMRNPDFVRDWYGECRGQIEELLTTIVESH